MKVQIYVIMPDDRNLRQGILNCRARTRRNAPVVLKCQLNLTIALKAIEIKHQITTSIKSIDDHQLAIATHDEFTLSAWRSNFELQLTTSVWHDFDCRRRTGWLCASET
jgi:hypothetical protein